MVDSPVVAAEAAEAAPGKIVDSWELTMENGMKLLIDIGNTSAKLAVMGTDIVHFERRHESWKETFARLMTMFPIIDVRLATVAEEDLELKSSLDALEIPVIWLTSSVPCPA